MTEIRRIIRDDSPEHLEMMENIKNELDDIESNYMDAVTNNVAYANAKRQEDYMNRLNGYFFYQYFTVMLGYFEDGLSVESLAQAVGTYIGLTVGPFRDKAFKEYTGDKSAELLSKGLDEFYKNKAEKAGPDSRWAKAYEKRKAVHEENKDVVPTPRMLALQRIAWTQRAWLEMREPDTDMNAVYEQYEKVIGSINYVAEATGISMDELYKEERVLLQQIIQDEPNKLDRFRLQSYFREFIDDGVRPAPPKIIPHHYIDAKGKMHSWEERQYTGEFLNEDGTPYTKGFTLSKPKTVEEYAELTSDFIMATIHDTAKLSTDSAEYREAIDTIGNRYSVMVAAMEGDGYRESDIEAFYNFATDDIRKFYVKSVNPAHEPARKLVMENGLTLDKFKEFLADKDAVNTGKVMTVLPSDEERLPGVQPLDTYYPGNKKSKKAPKDHKMYHAIYKEEKRRKKREGIPGMDDAESEAAEKHAFEADNFD